MHALLQRLLELPPWAIVATLSMFALLESSTMIGAVIPGETALIFGGALAYYGRVSLIMMAGIGALAAVIGDSIGYYVGARWGDRIMKTRLARRIGKRRWDRARAHLHKQGFAAVLFGRFGAWVRALIPMLAGTARMPYSRFLIANVIGGTLWAIAAVLAGFAAGAAWHRVHWVALAIGAGVMATLVLVYWKRGQRRTPSAGASDRGLRPAKT